MRRWRPTTGAAATLVALLASGCAGWPFFPAAPQPEAPAPIVVASPVTPETVAARPAGAPGTPAAQAPAAAAAPAAPGTPAANSAAVAQAHAVPPGGAASAPAVAPAPPFPPPPPPEPPPPPVDPATRASFDEAVRMLRAGRLPEAERALRALAERQPELGGIHANLGLLYRKAGRLEESATALQRAVELSPKQAAYHNQLGLTWRALGRFDHARKAYETAIELDPTHAGALINLAILNDLYLGEPARAVELYTRGAALLPAEAATINKWLTEVKGRKGDPKLAASAPAPSAAPGAAAPAAPPRKEKE
jgi:Flp pilus assembly protein TadD